MARFDKAPEGGKFRAEAAAALSETAGAWGDGDLLVVTLDASGQAIEGTVASAYGVISTSEGRPNTHYTTAAAQKQVVAGNRYTVLRSGEILDAATFSTQAYSAGDVLYGIASGGVATASGATVGSPYIGIVVPREADSTQLRVVVDVNGQLAYAT